MHKAILLLHGLEQQHRWSTDDVFTPKLTQMLVHHPQHINLSTIRAFNEK